MTYYDIHCHIFNKDVIIRRLVNVVQSLLAVKDLLENEVSAEHIQFKIEGINKTLQSVTRESSEEVYKTLDQVYQGKVVTTPLMFDLSYADDNDDNEHKNKRYRRRIKRIFWLLSVILIPFIRGKVKRKLKSEELVQVIDEIRDQIIEFNKNFDKKSEEEVEIFDDANYDQQIADLEYLAANYKTIRPFFSVDPRREYKGGINMYEKVKEKLLSPGARFAGIKLYSPAGFSPTDPVLMGDSEQRGIYAFCEENNIPITVHNSNAGFACLSTILKVRGHVLLNENLVEPKEPLKFHYKFFSLKASEAIKERAQILNHPKLWKLVLEKYPKLTINFAHFGGAGQIMEYVNYAISKTRIDIEAFEDALLNVPAEMKETIAAAYSKRGKKMVLRENLTIGERAKIWNAMYSAGLINNWAKAIFDIVRNPEYPNACTDLSCFSEGILIKSPENNQLLFSIKERLKTFKSSFFDKLTAYEKSKFLYGSDFFLAQFFGPTMQNYFADFREAFGNDFDIIASKNPERFLNI